MSISALLGQHRLPFHANLRKAIVALASLALVGSVLVPGVAANAAGIYNSSTGSGTVECSLGGYVTVSVNVVSSQSACAGQLNLPSTVTTLGDRLFENSTALTGIFIPAGVTTIPVATFQKTTALANVIFASGSQLTTIAGWAFHESTGLMNIALPASVTSIGQSAFYMNSKLAAITIPANVTSIGSVAFQNSAVLGQVTFNGNAPATLGAQAFEGVKVGAKAIVPSATSGFGPAATTWNGLLVELVSPPTAPTAPTLNSATAAAGGATLSFTTPTSNGGAAISGYEYKVDAGSWVATGSTSTTINLTGFTPGTSYSVAVRATNSMGSSVESSSLTFTPGKIARTVSWLPTLALGFGSGVATPSSLASTTGSPATSYSVVTAGTTSCTVDTSTGDLTYTAAGNCTISATAAEDATYLEATTVVIFVIAAPIAVTVSYDYLAATSGNLTTSATFTPGATSGLVLPSPARQSFVFTGWFTASVGGTFVGNAGASYTPTETTTIYARWVQESLYGMGASSLIGTITTSSGSGNEYSISTGLNSSVKLVYNADAFAAGTVISVYKMENTTRAQNLITATTDFALNVVVSWLSALGTVPSTATDKPLSLTINNSAIKRGANIYALLGSSVADLGKATQDGVVTILITDDPEIVIANVRADAPTAVSATAGDSSAVVSWVAPASNGGSEITSYTATSSLGQACVCATTSCTFSSLVNGSSLTLSVTATNGVGVSASSSASPSVLPAAPVSSPPSSNEVSGPAVPVPVIPTVPVTPSTPVEPTKPSLPTVRAPKEIPMTQSVLALRSSGAPLLAGVVMSKPIMFDADSAKLDADDIAVLRHLARTLPASKGVLTITGFVRAKGKASASGLKLAVTRAKAVALALARLGFDAQIGYSGFGSRNMVSPTAGDRRVEIRWVAAK